jgi:HSP20 family protein
VTGDRKQQAEVNEAGYYSREFTYGSFERHLPLPAYVTAPEIQATYEGGVLQVVIVGGAKAPSTPPASKIPITVPTPAAKS